VARLRIRDRAVERQLLGDDHDAGGRRGQRGPAAIAGIRAVARLRERRELALDEADRDQADHDEGDRGKRRPEPFGDRPDAIRVACPAPRPASRRVALEALPLVAAAMLIASAGVAVTVAPG